MTEKFDVIIIGGGPNGLLCAAYLARAGLKVLILEKRLEMGGGLLTEEISFPGFYHDTHAIYMPMMDYAPAVRDLEFETRHRVEMITPELQIASLSTEERAACLYHSVEKTCESFRNFSEKDAETFGRLAWKFQGWMDDFIAPYTYLQPKPTLELAVAMEATKLGKEMFELTERTPRELVEEWFENEMIRGLMLDAICFWGLDPEQSGLGYLVPLYFNRSYNYRLVKGGSHLAAQAMIRDFLSHGGQAKTIQILEKILVEDGRVTGVEMYDGVVYEADAVVSTIDLHQTFLKYLSEDTLETEFVESIKVWLWEHWSFFSVHLAIDGPPPQFKAARHNREIDKALIYTMGCESIEDFLHQDSDVSAGRLDNIILHATFPTVFDRSRVRTEDGSTALLQIHVPYDLKEEKGWEDYNYDDKQALADRLIDILSEYTEGFDRESVLVKYTSNPWDIENKFSDMVKGSFKQGQYHPLQMGYMRPNDQCSTHRSPLKGLYMGGASTYPGGTVLLASGFLAADAVIEDLGKEKWWGIPEIIKKARDKGMPL